MAIFSDDIEKRIAQLVQDMEKESKTMYMLKIVPMNGWAPIIRCDFTLRGPVKVVIKDENFKTLDGVYKRYQDVFDELSMLQRDSHCDQTKSVCCNCSYGTYDQCANNPWTRVYIDGTDLWHTREVDKLGTIEFLEKEGK